MTYLISYAGLALIRCFNGKSAYPFLAVMLFLFSAFRFEVGCDWIGYLNQFYTWAGTSVGELSNIRDPLWVAIFIFQHWLGLPYPWINVVSSAIFFLGAHVLAQRQPDRLGFLVLLFPVLIINMPMSGIRQAAAIGFMFMAFVAFIDRRLLRFIVLTGIASGIHSSAIIFLLLTPLVRGEFTKTRLLLTALLLIPGTLASQSTQTAEVVTSRYLESDVDAAGAIFRIGLLAVTGLVFLMYLRRPWAAKFPTDAKLATIASAMMICLLCVLPVSTVIADRLGYYLVPIQTLILSRLPFLTEAASRNAMIAAPYVALFAVLLIWITFSGLFQQCYVPYQTWLLGFPSSRYSY